MEVGDVLPPVVGAASIALTAATLVVVHHAVASPQNVPLRPQVLMTEPGAPMQYDNRCLSRADLHHTKHAIPDRQLLGGCRRTTNSQQ
jgi:hypothetical protein